MNKLFRLLLITTFIFSTFLLVKPSQAFYLEVPQTIRNLLQTLQANSSSAQEAAAIAPMPSTPVSSEPSSVVVPSTQTSGDSQQTAPAPMQQPTMDSSRSTQPMPTVERREEMTGSNGQNSEPNHQGEGNMNPQDNERYLRDMRRGARDMSNQLRRFEAMYRSGTMPEAVREKVESARSTISAINAATSGEEMQNIDADSMYSTMRELDEERQNMERLKRMKSELRGMEQGMRMFKQQMRRLATQHITVPQEISDNVSALETAIATIKNATNWESAEEAMETLQDKMQSLDESRQQLEMLSRWPQTKRDMNKIVRDLTRGLTRARSMVTRISNSGVDVSAALSRFEEKINRLKAVRDEVVAGFQSGNTEDLFEKIQSDFFEQTDDTWQEMRMIETMSNLGRFASEFRKGINQAQREIRALERRRMNTAELKQLLNQAKTKGEEIIATIRGGLSEEEAENIMAQLEEMESLKEQFEDNMREITGENEDMPWEKGPQQFQQIRMSDNLGRMIRESTRSRESQGAAAPTTGQTPSESSPNATANQ